ncbi:alpha/beta hydrolase [Hymenobacter sp. 15J16-1T3B]|uniref:alpha/beta fold hydrolase n=1 Tax=Hymenobacter sp. 15J16-1T3B TaxID=2886941 RepID=UPI001D1306FB|nr:alpha/beta hydrolase [Hymenobacter sp. 15J16-1T3B]MCC3156276.1 alpha/beta hydrolase [Hymenobacter sp. 15J16-1T3B]
MSAAAAPVTLVFLHYWAGSGREWSGVVEALEADYPCLTPDLGGFGDAPPPARGYSVEAYASEVEALIGQQQLTEYVLVGHSMGGKIALDVAARQPPGLRGLALLTPSPPTPEPMREADRLASLRSYGDPAAAEATFEHITARPLPDALRQQVIADNLRTSKAAWDAWLLQGSKEDICALMPRVRVPVFLIAGTADPVLPPQVHQRELLPCLPEATTFHLIEGAGHLLPLEAPGEVASGLRQFMGELAATAQSQKTTD